MSPPAHGRPHRIVIVGGGAGGLELATRLGDTLGRRGRAEIVLVDRTRTHLWKPLLHEIAAGSMDPDLHDLDYLAQAHWHHFRFRLGEMDGLDRARREIHIAPSFDEEGREIVPRRSLSYDTLVIAVGSRSNDFGTPGAREHAISLDTPEEAERFHRRLIDAFLRAGGQGQPLRPEQLNVAIVGAGATGVELAAELRNAGRVLAAYGAEHIDPDRDMQLTIVEAAERILPALPERLAHSVLKLLRELKVTVHTGQKVARVTAAGVDTASGLSIPAELVVWAAGIQAPEFLKDLDGLESNRLNQLAVAPTLQTTRDPDIFAFGDCAACPWLGRGGTVPARAQAAHQQASHLLENLPRRLQGRPLTPFRYRDFGSLVSLGEYSAVGSLMGALTRGTLWVEGWFARMMYLLLYKQHELALHGFAKAALDSLARMITRRTEPRVKLH